MKKNFEIEDIKTRKNFEKNEASDEENEGWSACSKCICCCLVILLMILLSAGGLIAWGVTTDNTSYMSFLDDFIVDPCAEFALTNPVNMSASVNYNYTDTAAHFNMTPFVVSPKECTVSYSCAVISGSAEDLCNYSDGTTSSTFDGATGDFSFQSSNIE